MVDGLPLNVILRPASGGFRDRTFRSVEQTPAISAGWRTWSCAI